ncbi:hypothetical protein [Parachitinimonas caeni]|uniref:Transposase n=1 Tax=Parachitinimonas caeni TaxID=3031301 RepID=A0ABT7E3K0_9NEIS|nr:hypothetical protein [Parachitinimonas caeni]MDK2126886.1 hypothetical protein [Parachitinimonas caeni]
MPRPRHRNRRQTARHFVKEQSFIAGVIQVYLLNRRSPLLSEQHHKNHPHQNLNGWMPKQVFENVNLFTNPPQK